MAERIKLSDFEEKVLNSSVPNISCDDGNALNEGLSESSWLVKSCRHRVTDNPPGANH